MCSVGHTHHWNSLRGVIDDAPSASRCHIYKRSSLFYDVKVIGHSLVCVLEGDGRVWSLWLIKGVINICRIV